MKNFILSAILFLALALGAEAQTSLYKDTVQGAETIYLTIPVTGSYQAMSIDCDFAELGGTSDGTVTLQASNRNIGGSDGEWITLDSTYHGQPGQGIVFMDGDSYTIPDDEGAWKVQLIPPAFNYYRVSVAGTSGDTTFVEAHVVFKR